MRTAARRSPAPSSSNRSTKKPAARRGSTSFSVISVLEIAQALIRCPSVTPKDAGAQEYLTVILERLGFTCERLKFGEVENLFARIGEKGPHICFAGHTDVVPPGQENLWTHAPFDGAVKDGKLYGRGASDMKGAVAAFVAAAAEHLEKNKLKGSISLLITGDEEGPGVDGTIKVLKWMKENGHVPDVCLVGEPTNPKHLGQEIKIGRRGSLSGKITVTGKQGHAAYPHLADNPLPRFIKLLGALSSHKFDKGTEFFQPTNLEITSIDVGNPATNIIPAEGTALFNVRYNDRWSAEKLEQEIRKILDAVHEDYTLEIFDSLSKSFFTPPGAWSELVKKAVTDSTGQVPDYTTNGGTSDARFVHEYCPVVEFGGVNESIHQVDENTDVKVLEDLTKIYVRVLELYLQ
ncbi:MAG: succinyl-diaminopimelate desuccinylase [Alphaproteobacteria bacterium]|nr:succinyl-diaminopimelate desuccinylase [Alphaproteobacteria bacterium]